MTRHEHSLRKDQWDLDDRWLFFSQCWFAQTASINVLHRWSIWMFALFLVCVIPWAMTLAEGAPSDRPDIVIGDFEGNSYGDWKTTGDAFGPGPARGTLPNQMHVEGFLGKGLVNTFFQGDDSTGTLTSPPVRLDRKYIAFLIGGGKRPEALTLNLVIDGKVVRTATGPNGSPGGSETLAQEFWDVEELAGKLATIQIVDQAKGGWGHINVDQIVQTDRKPPVIQTDVKREIAITHRYLHLPIKTGGPKRQVKFLRNGQLEVRNEIELADGKLDWWAFMDVSPWRGETLTLVVDKLKEDSQALKAIEQSDTIKDSGNLYAEPLRGQFHFSTRRGWNNDPNGLVFYNGEYHLFYQHNPYGWNWGNMHWGHAVSRDLVHWQELGDKLAPDSLGPMFSGSAVVDWNNTSGFGKDGKPPLVLIYTAAGDPATQCIAYSNDGRQFTKYEGNPVVKQVTPGNRDPKVIWHEPTKKWVMVLYVEVSKHHTVHFFTSPNLRDWKLASVTDLTTPGHDRLLFECPDFFELAINGNPANKKWVLMGANTEFVVGSFDGTTFRAEQAFAGQKGSGFYAPQTFSDIPKSDGRRIQIGWFQTPTVGMPFNQSMSIPIELNLISNGGELAMTWTPVKELMSLLTRSYQDLSDKLTPGGPNPLAGFKAELCEVQVDIEPGSATEIALNIRGATVVYDVKKQELVVNGHRAPAPLRANALRLTVFCDRTGLEVFASDGMTYVPMPFQPKADNLNLAIEARGGEAKINRLQVHQLKTAWRP